jgi:hypothetical protein
MNCLRCLRRRAMVRATNVFVGRDIRANFGGFESGGFPRVYG